MGDNESFRGRLWQNDRLFESESARARAHERKRLHRGLLSTYSYVYVCVCVCMFCKCVRVCECFWWFFCVFFLRDCVRVCACALLRALLGHGWVGRNPANIHIRGRLSAFLKLFALHRQGHAESPKFISIQALPLNGWNKMRCRQDFDLQIAPQARLMPQGRFLNWILMSSLSCWCSE